MTNATAYCYNLSDFQKLFLSNQGMLTTVTIYSGSAGQQQQSSQGVATGQWKSSPQLYQLGGGYVTTIFADQTFYLSIQGTQMQVSAGASGDGIAQQISQLEPLPAKPAEPPSAAEMKPMAPMQPMTMTMGDMSMSMGEMRMGDMRMSTQTGPSQNNSSQSNSRRYEAENRSQGQSAEADRKKFCSHCGAAVGVRDRFCSQCGSRLN